MVSLTHRVQYAKPRSPVRTPGQETTPFPQLSNKLQPRWLPPLLHVTHPPANLSAILLFILLHQVNSKVFLRKPLQHWKWRARKLLVNPCISGLVNSRTISRFPGVLFTYYSGHARLSSEIEPIINHNYCTTCGYVYLWMTLNIGHYQTVTVKYNLP